jgi:signal transduction histidine kinase
VDPLAAIPIAGLALALLAALVAMRRRGDEVDSLRARLHDRDEPPAGTPPDDPLLDLLPVGLLVFDGVGRVARANDRAYALLGIPAGRLPGRSLMETFLDARIERLLGGLGEGAAVSTDLRTGDGEPRQLVVRATRRADDELVVVLEDATELRRLQQIRTQFIDNLSHELRTPLSTVSLLAETLARDAERADVPARMRERIAKIEVETGHLVQMVSELLELARIEGGSQLRLEDDIDLGRLADASAERLRLFAERQGVTIAVDVEPGLPAIRGDEARLGQVFINLVHNAVKFSPEGGTIEVRLSEGVLTVRDHGPGIPADELPHVFDRFWRSPSARALPGSGLGLSIVARTVREAGGQVGLARAEGGGTVATVRLPGAPTAPPEVPEVPEVPDVPEARANS